MAKTYPRKLSAKLPISSPLGLVIEQMSNLQENKVEQENNLSREKAQMNGVNQQSIGNDY